MAETKSQNFGTVGTRVGDGPRPDSPRVAPRPFRGPGDERPDSDRPSAAFSVTSGRAREFSRSRVDG